MVGRVKIEFVGDGFRLAMSGNYRFFGIGRLDRLARTLETVRFVMFAQRPPHLAQQNRIFANLVVNKRLERNARPTNCAQGGRVSVSSTRCT